MRDALNFCMDFIYYSCLGALLAFLLRGLLSERVGNKAAWLMGVQFVVVRQFVSYSSWAKQIIYGNDLHIMSSKQSIIPLAASMAVTLLVGMLLYKGRKIRFLSLAAAFYALMELIRFMIYPIAVSSINRAVDYCNFLFWEKNAVSSVSYQRMLIGVEILWNVDINVFMILGMVACIAWYKSYLRTAGSAKGELLLFVPELLGLVFVVMLRSILFYYEKEVYSLIDEYPEMNALIPALSLLCIASILLSVRTLAEVEQEHEKRRKAELYQISAEELKAHIGDMEQVRMQISGMKHDLKNYMADINALLAQASEGKEEAMYEVRHYLDSMQAFLEQSDREYHTKNPVTDAILGRYSRIAKERNISFSSVFLYPETLGIDVFDLSIILNNALENAFEACEEESDGARVELTSEQKGKMFLLKVQNTFTGTLDWVDGLPCSKKPGAGHGMGLWNIKNCAERYYGRLDFRVKECCCELTVMLQGKSAV